MTQEQQIREILPDRPIIGKWYRLNGAVLAYLTFKNGKTYVHMVSGKRTKSGDILFDDCIVKDNDRKTVNTYYFINNEYQEQRIREFLESKINKQS